MHFFFLENSLQENSEMMFGLKIVCRFFFFFLSEDICTTCLTELDKFCRNMEASFTNRYLRVLANCIYLSLGGYSELYDIKATERKV